MYEKSTLQKLDAVMVRISKWLSYIAAALLIVIMLLAFFDAMSSKFLRQSIPRATELITYLNVPIVFFGVGIVQLKDKHTTVDLLYGKYPVWLKKTCYVVANLAAAGVCSYLAYLGFKYGVALRAKGSLSGAITGFKLWPFGTIMGIGWALFAVTSLWSVFRLLFNLIPLPGAEEEAFMEATKHLPLEADADMSKEELIEPTDATMGKGDTEV